MFKQLLEQFLFVEITTVQIYLLCFLLGSFTVATLSDLKYLSAQKEFLEIWVLFILAMLIVDVYNYYHLGQNIIYLLVKWSLIVILLPVYFHWIRRIAWGDVFAKMAACSLFSPLFILAFMIIIRLIDATTRKLWQKWGRGRFYPFMPVIFLTTIFLLFVALFVL